MKYINKKKDTIVENVMMHLDTFPIVGEKFLLKKVILLMSSFGIGVACVIDDKKKLQGIFTDGDLRRKIIKIQKPLSAFFSDDISMHMNRNPISINAKDDMNKTIKIMQDLKIWDLPVMDDNDVLVGLLHLHPAINQILKIEDQ